MSKRVVWTKDKLDYFLDQALLTEDEEMILRTRIAGWSRVKQAMELNVSISTVDRTIKRLKTKYDEVFK